MEQEEISHEGGVLCPLYLCTHPLLTRSSFQYSLQWASIFLSLPLTTQPVFFLVDGETEVTWMDLVISTQF